MNDQRRGWQEQLGETREQMNKESQGDAGIKVGTDSPAQNTPRTEVEIHRFEPRILPPPGPKSAPTPYSSSPGDIEVNYGNLRVKSPSGEVNIPLSKAVEDRFIDKALEYQQAIINEKRASTWSTIAMAALTALSAVAMALAMARSSLGKKGPSSLDV